MRAPVKRGNPPQVGVTQPLALIPVPILPDPGIRRTQGTAPTVKAPAVTAELRAMVTHLPGDL